MVWASCALESACVVKAGGQLMEPRWFDVSLTCCRCGRCCSELFEVQSSSCQLLDIQMLMQDHEWFYNTIGANLLPATTAEEI